MQFIRLHIALIGALGLLVAFLAMLSAVAGALDLTFALAVVMMIAASVTGLLLLSCRDTTKLQTSHAILQDRLHQYTAVFATDADGWCLFNAQNLLVAASLFEKGLFPQKMTHFDDLVTSLDDSSVLIEKYRLLQQSGRPFTLILKLRDANKTLLVRGQRYPEQTDARFFILHIRDIGAVLADADAVEATNGKKEEAVRTQAIHQALDALATPLWLRDRKLNLVWCNATYARWQDRTRENVLAAHLELCPPQADTGGSKELAARARTTGQAYARWHLIIDGQRRLIESLETAIPGDGDFGMIGTAYDVTSIEETQSELQRHIAAHHEVLENLGTPIAIYGPDQRLEFYNRAYIRLWDGDENFLSSKPSFGEIL
ncbi:MAG: hypothetical protein ABL897_06795, partial [Hyphomicrobium sp.]